MDQWIHAGTHHGIIDIDSRPLEIKIDSSQNITNHALKLSQITYKVQKDPISNSIEKQKVIGKQGLFIKSYISKFKSKNIHRFLQKSHISQNYTLEFQVFIEQTKQAIDRILGENKKLTQHIRPRNNSQAESILSENFSDKVNEIQIKGQNKIYQHVSFVSQNALLGSQSKIDPQILIFSSYNKKRPQKIVRPKNTNLVIKMNRVPMTNENNQGQKIQKEENNQQDNIIESPQLKQIELKRLSSQEVKPAFQLLSPLKLKTRKLPLITDRIQKYEADQEKRRKLLQDFQIKKIEFKKRIQKNKQQGQERIKPATDRENKKERKLSKSSSTRSMRSIKLSQLQKLPDSRPWEKKEKQISKNRNKKLLYFICFVMLFAVYFLMQPFKNFEMQTEPKNQKKISKKQKKKIELQNKFKVRNLN